MKPETLTIARTLEYVVRDMDSFLTPVVSGNRDGQGKPLFTDTEARKRLRELCDRMLNAVENAKGRLRE